MSVGYCLSLLIVVVGDRIVVHSCQCTSVVDIFSVDYFRVEKQVVGEPHFLFVSIAIDNFLVFSK